MKIGSSVCAAVLLSTLALLGGEVVHATSPPAAVEKVQSFSFTDNKTLIVGELANQGLTNLRGFTLDYDPAPLSVAPTFLKSVILKPGQRVPFAFVAPGVALFTPASLSVQALPTNEEEYGLLVAESKGITWTPLQGGEQEFRAIVFVRNVGDRAALALVVLAFRNAGGDILGVGYSLDPTSDQEAANLYALAPGQSAAVRIVGALPAAAVTAIASTEVQVFGILSGGPSRQAQEKVQPKTALDVGSTSGPASLIPLAVIVSRWPPKNKIRVGLLASVILILATVSAYPVFATSIAPPWTGEAHDGDVAWNLGEGDLLAETHTTTGNSQNSWIYEYVNWQATQTRTARFTDSGRVKGTLHADSGYPSNYADVFVYMEVWQGTTYISGTGLYSKSVGPGEHIEIDTSRSASVDVSVTSGTTYTDRLYLDTYSQHNAYSDFKEYLFFTATKLLDNGAADVTFP